MMEMDRRPPEKGFIAACHLDDAMCVCKWKRLRVAREKSVHYKQLDSSPGDHEYLQHIL